jgi:hypothetical protein
MRSIIHLQRLRTVGRMFSSSPKLSAAKRAEPRKGPFTPKPTPKPKQVPALKIDFSGIPDDELPPLKPLDVPRKKLLPKSAHTAGSCPYRYPVHLFLIFTRQLLLLHIRKILA